MLDLAVQHLLSPANPLIKRLAHLHDVRGRREQGLFLVEGRRAIDECISAGMAPVHLLVRDDCQVPETWPAVTLVSARALERLSQASSPSGFLAACTIPSPPPLRPMEGGLILAEVADPGNLGTLLRTAAALGIRQAVLIGTADPWGPKSVQASAGAMGRLAIHTPELPAALIALADAAPLCALLPRGGVAPQALTHGSRWLVIGGEAHGIPPQLVSRCPEQVTLPMPGGTESLNAAIAGAIACYLLMRSHP
jgi:TrmH family RNA methyltransferase